jgi:organic hydroperoxide reductase OsmC/OhrA
MHLPADAHICRKLIMHQEHHYRVRTIWQGNRGTGTSHAAAYDRSHTVINGRKPALELTTDHPRFGDRSKLNPEDLLVSALSSCHMLSYLYLCAVEGVVVIAYTDEASGVMIERPEGGGQFQSVTLHPVVTVAEPGMVEQAIALHHRAHEICFIASSVNFPVNTEPVCQVAQA